MPSRPYLIAFVNCVYIHLIYKCGLVFVRVRLFPFAKILEYSSILQNRAVSVSLLSNLLVASLQTDFACPSIIMVTVNEDCILNSPTPIAALTNGIAAIFVPRRSVRLFVLATLAICAAGVMWIACNQSKPSVSAECSQDVQCHWWVESYFKVGEFDYAESMLRKCIAVHSSFGCSHCVSQVQDKRYLALVLSKQGRLAESNAIFNELFEAAVAHSEGNDVFLDEDFRAVANCSPHEHGYRVEDLLILQANPTPCRLHKNCEHDVDVEARGLFGH